MRIRRADDRIDGLDDAVQRRIGADGHVRAAEIVIDRADHAGNVQQAELFALLGVDALLGQQLVEQAGPLLAEQIRAGQRAVAANHHQIGDAAVHQIAGGRQAALALLEVHAACRTDDGAAAMDDAGHRRPVGLLDVFAAVDHTLVAFANEVDLPLRVISGVNDMKT